MAQLRRAEAPLELARALVELGAARRRKGQRADAEPILREALDLAGRCGAERLATRAEEELQALGLRPRRREMTGWQALTPSEQRVAARAAKGMSNRQIAQELFVTVRTVENQLYRAYQKLGVSGREELRAAVGEETPVPA